MVCEVPTIFPVLVEGERLRLREVDIDDFEATWEWASRAEYFRFLPIDQPDRDAERAWLASVVAEAHETARRSYQLGVELVEGSRLIGMVRLEIESERHRSAGIGYGISPEGAQPSDKATHSWHRLIAECSRCRCKGYEARSRCTPVVLSPFGFTTTRRSPG